MMQSFTPEFLNEIQDECVCVYCGAYGDMPCSPECPSWEEEE